MHRMAKWQHLPAITQERISSRCQWGDIEMGDASKPDNIPSPGGDGGEPYRAANRAPAYALR
ncbi:MAG: hypothetical protein JNM11_01545 [Chitinimonas sp.]|nr:hypothetical protein [Chitinimonas sp.]